MCVLFFCRCLVVYNAQIIHLPSPFYFRNLHNFSLVVVIEWTTKSVWWEHGTDCNELECICCAMSQCVCCMAMYSTRTHSWHYMDVHNKRHITHHQLLVNPHHGFISGQNGTSCHCRCCFFFATLRQFPFYLYPNRGHSGPLTVFIDLFAFVIIYVCDCFSFFFSSVFALLVCFIIVLYHYFFHAQTTPYSLVRLHWVRTAAAIDINFCIFCIAFAIAVPMHCLHM